MEGKAMVVAMDDHEYGKILEKHRLFEDRIFLLKDT